MNGSAIIIAIYVVFIFIFIAITIWMMYTSRPPSIPTLPTTTDNKAEYMYSCVETGLCEDGLLCDYDEGVCKLELGEECNLASDCANEYYCSGVCVNTDPGLYSGLAGSPCPCGNNMTCHDNICKKNTSQLCNMNKDCLSNKCLSGICGSGVADGDICTTDNECANSNCSSGYCQPQGEVTGAFNAVCNDSAVCNAGLSCTSGICTSNSRGLTNSCNVNNSCVNPLVCLNDDLTECISEDNYCTCQYSYPDPNSCSSGSCTSPYTCYNGDCLGDSNFNVPAFLPAQCTSSQIVDNNNILSVRYSDLSGDSYYGSFDTTYKVERTVDPGASRFTDLSVVYPGVGIYDSDNNAIYVGADTLDGFMYNDTQGLLLTSYSRLYIISFGSRTPVLPNISDPLDPSLEAQVYTSDGTILELSKVEYNSSQDIIGVQSTSGIFYTLDSSGLYFVEMVNTLTNTPLGPILNPQFYYDIPYVSTTQDFSVCSGSCPPQYNISYISNEGEVVFNGNAKGAKYPKLGGDPYVVVDYSLYEPSQGLSSGNSTAIILKQGKYFLVTGPVSDPSIIPGYIDSSTLLYTSHSISYILPKSICS